MRRGLGPTYGFSGWPVVWTRSTGAWGVDCSETASGQQVPARVVARMQPGISVKPLAPIAGSHRRNLDTPWRGLRNPHQLCPRHANSEAGRPETLISGATRRFCGPKILLDHGSPHVRTLSHIRGVAPGETGRGPGSVEMERSVPTGNVAQGGRRNTPSVAAISRSRGPYARSAPIALSCPGAVSAWLMIGAGVGGA